ncbi:LacI family DNA-binding transcriptional regulator [Mycetocola zhadangensis]|uniref:LacI family DNA-binding transcriptional regulator n=1 Tax=Mycetocola zhadangensis TaxID=1164595 RepID=UPI003A4D261B
MQDVARLANVSIATVSFTVNNSKPVSPATRARVEAAMQELGFRRNAVGRALASKRTHILALLYPALQHRFRGTVVDFFTSAASTASERGYNLVLWPASNDSELDELTSTGLVDGVLLMEVQVDDPRVEQLTASRTPFALIGRTGDPSALDYVDIDFENTVAAAIEHLAQLGHTSIGLLDGGVGRGALRGYAPVVRTRESFAQEMAARGLTAFSFTCDENPAAGREAAATLMNEAPGMTALLLMNEHAGPGLVTGLHRLGMSVPADLSILSLASSREMAAMTDPDLSVLSAPSIELGRRGVELLIDQLDGGNQHERQSLVMCAFEPGNSTAPPRRAPPSE